MTDITELPNEAWEQEILSLHRWGQHKEQVGKEHSRLKKLWDAIQPVEPQIKELLDEIIALEICNWNLEKNIFILCTAIGSKEPANFPIGHMASISSERWKKVWAYYISLKNWLPCEGTNGYSPLLEIWDSDGSIQKHVEDMLGERTEVKELYVERFCLCLEMWLGGYFPAQSAQMRAHQSAVDKVEQEIKNHDPEAQILKAMNLDGDGRLQPCSHKAFRRYDIIISSIGCGKWRGAIPLRGKDGFERADVIKKYLQPIERWIKQENETLLDTEFADEIISSLGKPDKTKIFLASLLVSLLRSQEIAARKRAETRSEKSNMKNQTCK